MKEITKRFGGVQALKGVDFALEAGEVHALVGENGAGKSTLMKILAGALEPDAGEIWFEGRRVRLRSVREARRQGVVMVYQELNLAANLTVAENLFLGRMPPLLSLKVLEEMASTLIASLDLPLDPRSRVGDLEVGRQQLVAVAQALAQEAKVLIFDEPTAALSADETKTLFTLIRRLQEKGVGIVYISHRLEEIFTLAHRITVLRDGERVATEPVDRLKPDRVVALMVGRSLERSFPKAPPPEAGGVYTLRVHLPPLTSAALQLRLGEIVGLAGVVGSGRSQVLEALFGLRGEAFLDTARIQSPRDAIRKGLFLVPGDRKTQGLVLGLSARENLALSILERIAPRGVLQPPRERAVTQEWFARLRIHPPAPELPAQAFSGGNQQKIVLAKALAPHPRLLLLEEPTRGVDVGVRHELYQLLRELACQGLSLVLSSGDTEELLTLCHRILVFRRGQVAAELRAPFSREEVVAYVTGAAMA